jgi:hypothetical protein
MTIRIDDQGGEENYYVVEAVKQILDIQGQFEYDGGWYDLYTNQYLYDSLKAAGVNLLTQFDTSFSDTYSRVNIYTADPVTENLKFGNSLAAYKRVFLNDLGFNGGSYNLRVFLQRDQVASSEQWSRGRALIKVKSVSKEYFTYLTGYEQKGNGGLLNTVGPPIKIDGNVQNGLGVVGGVYLQQFAYYFDKWEF